MSDKEKLEELISKIEQIVPYVVATLPKPCDGHDNIWAKHGGKFDDDWSACHKGRAFSSVNQLNNLLKLAIEYKDTVGL